jgi:hypothetical protein
MSFDFSKVLSELGEDMIAKTGAPLGLSKDQSVQVANAVASHFSKGEGEAARLAAADTGLKEDVVAAMTAKLVEVGKEKLLTEGPVGDAVNAAKAQAQSAISNAGGELAKGAGGLLGRLFGRS